MPEEREDEQPEPSPCCEKCIKDKRTQKYCFVYQNDCHYHKQREDFNLPDLNHEGWILSEGFRAYIKKAYIKMFPDEPPMKREEKLT